MIARGGVALRTSEFGPKEKAYGHAIESKAIYEAVLEKCSRAKLPYQVGNTSSNLANIYMDKVVARDEKEFRANVEEGLRLQKDALCLLTKDQFPEDWGIIQHNMGISYILLSETETEENASNRALDLAVHHSELSFQVRNPRDSLQYWVASCRTLGEALIARSTKMQAGVAADVAKALEVLTNAAEKIDPVEHPLQWEQLQAELGKIRERG